MNEEGARVRASASGCPEGKHWFSWAICNDKWLEELTWIQPLSGVRVPNEIVSHGRSFKSETWLVLSDSCLEWPGPRISSQSKNGHIALRGRGEGLESIWARGSQRASNLNSSLLLPTKEMSFERVQWHTEWHTESSGLSEGWDPSVVTHSLSRQNGKLEKNILNYFSQFHWEIIGIYHCVSLRHISMMV